MRERYTYEIHTTQDGTTWKQTVRADDVFSRAAPAVARSLLENWIIDHPDRLTGGERIVVHDPIHHPHDDDFERISPKVRVRVFAGSATDKAEVAIATGFLGHDERDFPTLEQPVRRIKPGLERIRKTVNEHRVETGLAAALSLILGYAVTRKLRGRRKNEDAA